MLRCLAHPNTGQCRLKRFLHACRSARLFVFRLCAAKRGPPSQPTHTGARMGSLPPGPRCLSLAVRTGTASQVLGAIARLWRECDPSRSHNASSVGREKPCICLLRAATLASSCPTRGRHRGAVARTGGLLLFDGGDFQPPHLLSTVCWTGAHLRGGAWLGSRLCGLDGRFGVGAHPCLYACVGKRRRRRAVLTLAMSPIAFEAVPFIKLR